MKKVLIISSSPRKSGNSDMMCDKFAQGAIEAGHSVEKISLRDFKINYCSGCGYCNTAGKCSQKDDMSEIIDKMINSDVIVFGSPIYFYAISGQMKTFIDRLCAKYTQIRNKEFYYLLSAADCSKNAIQFALGEFKGLMACLEGSKEQGYIFAGGVWQKGDILNTNFLQQAFDTGKSV